MYFEGAQKPGVRKKSQLWSQSEKTKFQSHPSLDLIPLIIWRKLLSLSPTWVVFRIISMTGGCCWQLVGGVTDAKCFAKDRRVQFNK